MILRLIILFIPYFLFAQIPEITNSTVVGGVTESSARLWVRLSQSGTLNVELSTSESFQNVISGIEVQSSEESNLAAIINVNGLLPSTKYYYRIIYNGAVVPDKPKSFTTFPEPGAPVNFSFGFGSCQQSGTFLPSNTTSGNIFREIVKHKLNLFLQIGDWTYPDTTDFLPANNDYFSADFSRVQMNYLSKYNKIYPMDTLLRTTPIDYVYDDHDYMNNNASATTSSYAIADKPNAFGNEFILEEIISPPNTRENAIRGYLENFPAYDLANASRGIYHNFTFGSAEFFVLDLRSQRSPNLQSIIKSDTSGKWIFSPPEGHSILGRDNSPGNGESQLTWFLNALRNSSAKWKFLVCSVPFNKSQRAIIDASIQLQDITFNIPGYSFGVKGIAGAMEVSDKWAGFPEDIDTVLSFIKLNNIKNVMVLSGDSHTSAIDDGTNAGLPELMSANLDITNSRTVAGLASLGINIWNRGGQGLTTNEFNNAFGKIDVFGTDSVKFSLVDESGKIFASYTLADQTNTSIVNEPGILTDYYSINNFPNPFNPSTNIRIVIGQNSYVRLIVYDLLGREIQTLVNENKSKGEYNLVFDGSELPSGIYLCNLSIGDNSTHKMKIFRTHKLLLLK